jgi:hypothetical protein
MTTHFVAGSVCVLSGKREKEVEVEAVCLLTGALSFPFLPLSFSQCISITPRQINSYFLPPTRSLFFFFFSFYIRCSLLLVCLLLCVNEHNDRADESLVIVYILQNVLKKFLQT